MTSKEKIEALHTKALEKKRIVSGSIRIDSDFRPLQLVYNQATGVIVVSAERSSPGAFDRRLFLRHKSERAYRQVSTPAEHIHLSDIVTSATRPFVYYRTTRVTQTRIPGEFGGRWLSVERLDLARQATETLASEDTLLLPEAYVTGWVSQLHGVSFDDAIVFCSCGLQRPTETEIQHWLCGLESATRKLSLLSRLEAVWF